MIPFMLHSIAFYFPQIQALTIANLKARYRKTVAGFLWVIINPLILFGVQSLVFKTFLKLQIANYSLFLLSGLLPWIFITGSLTMCTTAFLSSSHLLKSFQLPPLVYLFAQLFDNLFNFLAAFLIILTPLMLMHPGSRVALLLLPFAILLLTCGVIGLTWLLATAQVFFRDTQFILNFAISVTFFLTPVFYPVSYVPEQYHWMIHVNPLYQLVRPFQCIINPSTSVEILSAFEGAAVVAALALSFAAFVWRRNKNEIYFNL